MKILALDTSATVASIAVTEDLTPLAVYTLNNKNTHSETLLPMIESALKALSLTAEDIELFALSAGPGSFTGVRIGAATLKGLAFAKERPCVEVSTLEALANNLVIKKGLICPVMNARRSQVYTSELDGILAEYKEPIALVGDGYEISEEGLKKAELDFVPEALRLQSALSVAAIAFYKYKAGDKTTDAALSVNYLRPSQAERERVEREKQSKS